SMHFDGFFGLSYSTMGNPNHLGSFLSILIPFSFYIYVEKNEKVALTAYGFLFYALLCTRTRGAWIGTFVSVLVYLLLKYKYLKFTSQQKRKCINVLIVSIILVIVLSLSDNFDFVFRILSIFFDFGDFLKKRPNTSSGGYVRLVTWGRIIEIIRINPILGIGTENLGQVMDSLYREFMYSKIGVYQIYDTAHNDYLQIAVTSGIPSLFTYFGFAYFTVSKSILRIKVSDFYIPVIAALLGYFAFGMFNNSLIMFEYIIWILFGILSSNDLIKYSDEK
ncbi:MAG: O-antigen ligase family protein, partial [Candidatus Paracaedibacteraceae bacterium]|nr:O-antigen ligase family protein [Candidatus Paracaedibacteraceae bacterium]